MLKLGRLFLEVSTRKASEVAAITQQSNAPSDGAADVAAFDGGGSGDPGGGGGGEEPPPPSSSAAAGTKAPPPPRPPPPAIARREGVKSGISNNRVSWLVVVLEINFRIQISIDRSERKSQPCVDTFPMYGNDHIIFRLLLNEGEAAMRFPIREKCD